VLDAYQDDLAYVHDAGFGHIAANAAPMTVALLRRSGVTSGCVVELGCGSGISSRCFRDAGFEVVGFDLSDAMIHLARKRVPDADFRLESFVTAELPSCVAVTAFGEVLNYTFDPENSPAVRVKLFERVHQALAPGGLFVFDLAEPARALASGAQRTFFEGADWAILLEVDANRDKTLLTRRNTTFRRQGEFYQRSLEVHQLQLVDRAEVTLALQQIGFSVQVIESYGARRLPPGLPAFIARK
jgi:SAM-dependent methyltransferase